MVSSINELSVGYGDYTLHGTFMHLEFESYMGYLKDHPDTQITTVDKNTCYKYENDLYGLFLEMGIPVYWHWVVMRLNGFLNPLDYRLEYSDFVIPSIQVLNRIKQIISSTSTKIN